MDFARGRRPRQRSGRRLVLINGRVAGISGILGGLIEKVADDGRRATSLSGAPMQLPRGQAIDRPLIVGSLLLVVVP